jgi:hypothetical protein
VIAERHGVSRVSTRLAEREQGHRLFDLLRRGNVSAPGDGDHLFRLKTTSDSN